MKAIVNHQYGAPEVLRLDDVPKPVPKRNQILIKVHAAEVTKGDCELRSFNFPVKWFSIPLRLVFGVFKPRKKILGGYFSGEVVAVGSKVTKFKGGEKVFGASKLLMGAYAEFLAVPENYTIAPIPANISFEAAATVPLGGLNALHFLRLAKVSTGDTLIVNGAGGSIGTYAVQIAKSMGAEVTAVDSDLKREMLLRLGADHFIDYRQQDFRQDDKKYDVIFDMLASSPLDESIATLNPGGRYISANPTFKKMTSAKRVHKETGKTLIYAFAGETLEELLTLKQMIEDEKISPTVDHVFSMEQAVEAHQRVEAEQRLGCTVITMIS